MADMATSVLAKLKNKAKSSGISYQQCLQLTGICCQMVNSFSKSHHFSNKENRYENKTNKRYSAQRLLLAYRI